MQHRIRRVDAETALGVLRRPAIKVAAGVIEAAVLHLRSLIVRLRLANREFRQAERKLDGLCAALGKEAPDGEDAKPCDAAILASLPGSGMAAADAAQEGARYAPVQDPVHFQAMGHFGYDGRRQPWRNGATL